MGKTAADVLVDTLVDDWGVRRIFSLPGDGINGIDASLRQRQDGRIALTMFRDKLDELLVQGLGSIPGPQRPKKGDGNGGR